MKGVNVVPVVPLGAGCMCVSNNNELITSNINIEEEIPILANIIFPIAKFPIGALTETSEVIEPTVVIQPGVATGVTGVGSPRDKPPKEDVKP